VQSDLSIVVIDGNGKTNAAVGKKEPSTQRITVRVEAGNNPVSGARVSFETPKSDRPGGTIGGRSVVTVVTDASGIASVSFQPNRKDGVFRIEIVATYMGRSAASFVTQTNEQTAAKPGNHKNLFLVAGGGAAAGIGGALLNGPDTANSDGMTQGWTPVLQPWWPISLTNGLGVFDIGSNGGAGLTQANVNSYLPSLAPCILHADSRGMSFNLGSVATWITVSPTSGTLAANGSTAIVVESLDLIGLPLGANTATVVIGAPGYDLSSKMRIHLDYTGVGFGSSANFKYSLSCSG
jgi:hypothetical protein